MLIDNLIAFGWRWLLDGLYLADWGDIGAVIGLCLRLVVLVMIAAAAVKLCRVIAVLVRALYRASMRYWAARDLGVRLSRACHVSRLKCSREIGAFLLEFPQWVSATRGGVRDRRTNDYRTRVSPSVVEVGDWRIVLSGALEMYDLVNALRAAGHAIGPDELEHAKARRYNDQAARASQATDVDALVSRFASDPTQFEHFCAEVFTAAGCRARTTPASRDGGVDIRMDKDGVRTVVECKCYQRSHAVGRPVIQRLRGANETELADRMLVVTTSYFSREAVTYAQQVGVELMDGDSLMALCRRVWGGCAPMSLLPAETVRLSREDLLAQYPPDMR